MAAFPAVTPDERGYTLGEVPTAEYRGEGGVAIRFTQGSLMVGQQLTLPFTNRPLSQIESIWDHYHAQESDTFTLPSAVWCGHSGGDAMADSSLVWRYAQPVEPEHVKGQKYSVTVVLEAVGVAIAGTTVDSPITSDDLGIVEAVAISALPPRPTPIPDPEITPPVIVVTPDATAQLPPGVVTVGSGAVIRWSTAGIPETGEVSVGSSATLETGTI